jgi:hypothetical protein
MEINPPRDDVPSDRPMVQYRCDEYAAVDLPDLPTMPENIRNFDGITLTFDFFF